MSSIQPAMLSQPMPLTDATALNPYRPATDAQSPEKVAKDFEGVFATMILKEMRQTLDKGSLFGEDPSDIYGGFFDQFIGEHMADSGGFGMAKMVRDALMSQQAAVDDPARNG